MIIENFLYIYGSFDITAVMKDTLPKGFGVYTDWFTLRNLHFQRIFDGKMKRQT